MSKTAHIIGKEKMFSWAVHPIKAFFGLKTFQVIAESIVEQSASLAIPVVLVMALSSNWIMLGKGFSYKKQKPLTESEIMKLPVRNYRSSFQKLSQ